MTVDEAKEHSKAIHEAVDALNAVVQEATKDGMLVELSVFDHSDISSRPHQVVQIDNLAVHVGCLR